MNAKIKILKRGDNVTVNFRMPIKEARVLMGLLDHPLTRHISLEKFEVDFAPIRTAVKESCLYPGNRTDWTSALFEFHRPFSADVPSLKQQQ